MKKYKTTIIALLVLVVAVAATVLVLKFTGGDDDSSSETDSSETTSEKLFSLTSKEVVKVEACYESAYVLELITETDGEETTSVWTCTSDEKIEANHNSVASKLSSIVSAQGTIITDFSDMSDYGFVDGKSNIYCKISTSDGTSETAYIGNYDYSQSYRYVVMEGVSDKIYKVGVYTAKYLLMTKEDIIALTVFNYLSTDIPLTFTVYANGEKALDLKCIDVDEDDGASWSVVYPIERDGANSKVNGIVEAMKDISLSGIAKEKVTQEELVDYGLSPAGIEYYLTVESEDKSTVTTHKILVGNKTTDGSYYYCLIDDGDEGLYDVYTVQTGYIYKTINALDYIDTNLYMKDSDLLKSVDIIVNGEAHKLRYERTTETKTGSDGTEETEEIVDRFFDGKEAPDNDDYSIVVSDNRFTIPTSEDVAKNKDADITNDVLTSNPYDCFNHLLGSLYMSLVISEVDLNEPTAEERGEMLASVTYTENDGSVYKINLYKRDNTTAYAYVNDKYAGGYCRTTQLFGDDYANYDYMASLDGMKAVMELVP